MPLSTIEYTLYFTRSTQHSVFKVLWWQAISKTLICDFESVLILALRCHFPNSRLKGCFFHHIKAIWTKVQDRSLDWFASTTVKQRQEASTHTDVSSLLAYTHPTDELHCSTDIRGHREHTTPTALYLLPRDLLSGSFPPALWNVSQETVRTNNTVEGWHNLTDP